MKLGLGLDLYRGATLTVPVERVRRAESLGYHSVWTAEAYGADALSPLAYLAGLTTRIRLGCAVAQVAARPPATLAMHAMTIDALAGGDRMIVGIGVSGPQIVEGWYGQPWGRPNARLRDYVAIVRTVLRREPSIHEGPEISLPYRGPGALGQGKALRSILHPNPDIPVWIASGGPANTALAAEIADGWLPMGFGPDGLAIHGEALERGFARRADPAARARFEIFESCTVEITDDVQSAIDRRKPLTAMYVGGMGSPTHNYHRDAMARRGFPDAASRIGELWASGRKDAATEAVPDEYVEQTALLGTPDRIRRRWETEGWTRRGLTGVIVRARADDELALLANLAGG